MQNLFRSILLSLIACFVTPALGAENPPRYETRTDHSPDGIGKFYMGREIAHVMSPAGIVWLERDEREREEQPQTLLRALDLKPGHVVADLGAGSGYYSFRVASLVGPKGKVLAVDVAPEMLRFIDQRARKEGVTNLQTVRATPDDPRLPESVDLVLLVDVYHELEFPYEVMTRVRAALKPGGRVVLVEYRAEDPDVPIKEVHKMSLRQIRRELEAAGLQHERTIGTLPWQHIVIFKRATE